MPIIPPMPDSIADSHKNCTTIEDVFAAQGLANPYLPGSFGYGHQHDVHNADSAYQKGYAGYKGNKSRHAIQDSAQCA